MLSFAAFLLIMLSMRLCSGGGREGTYSTSILFLIYVLCTMICKAFHAFLELSKLQGEKNKKKEEREVMAWDISQYTGKSFCYAGEDACVQTHLEKRIKWLCSFTLIQKANSTLIITNGKRWDGEKKRGATRLCKWGSTQIQSMDRTRHRIFCKWLN